MIIKQDCPICGRKGNPGHVDMDKDEKTGVAVETVVGGVVGFFIGGPIGAAVGAKGFNEGMKWLVKRNRNTDSNGNVLYRFNCQNPDCKHTWTSWVRE